MDREPGTFTHRIIRDDGSWYEWVKRDSETAADWHVPEYHPPPRVEAWLTLPPGVVVERDLKQDYDWEYQGEDESYEPPWHAGPMPKENRKAIDRFEDEFGELACDHWGLPARDGVSAIARAMKRCYLPAIKEMMHDHNRMLWGDRILGKTATIPLVHNDDNCDRDGNRFAKKCKCAPDQCIAHPIDEEYE